MLEAVLDSLHNWFLLPDRAKSGTFVIKSGTLADEDFLLNGQYYRIEGSVLNDGLHRHPEAGMADETFKGVIVPMAVPPAVVALADEIAAWSAENPEIDLTGESFGGYSYTRGDAARSRWETAFAGRLRPWKKVCGR